MKQLLKDFIKYYPLRLYSETWDTALAGIAHRAYGGLSTAAVYDLSKIQDIEEATGKSLETEKQELESTYRKGMYGWSMETFAVFADLSEHVLDNITTAAIDHCTFIDVSCAWLVGRAAPKEKVEEYDRFMEKIHEGAYPTLPYVEDMFCGVAYPDTKKKHAECLLYSGVLAYERNMKDTEKLARMISEVVTVDKHHPAWYFPCEKEFILENATRA